MGFEFVSFIIASKFAQTINLDLVQATQEEGIRVCGQYSQRIIDDEQTNFVLAKIGASTGRNQNQFDLLGQFHALGFSLVDDFDSLFRASQATFTIGFDCTKRVVTAHTTDGANLTERLVIAAGCVCGQGSCFADNVDATGTRRCCKSMLVGKFRIKVD
ncbi:Uncharacterised protein [Chlamydia trachomatis]|nr:Uncharacterised protein [Chlamydia trachomatis]